jgi:hypothetical protein
MVSVTYEEVVNLISVVDVKNSLPTRSIDKQEVLSELRLDIIIITT